MTQKTYHDAEMLALSRTIRNAESAPLADRQTARTYAAELMRLPHIVVERIRWMLAGNYGYGAQVEMQRIQAIKRGNRGAQAMHLLAVLDCGCPARFTADAWHGLSATEKAALEDAIVSALSEEVAA
jgi:hypothetical protein